jgi:type IV pilus assembly protein PilC
MKTFNYSGVDSDGVPQSGVLKALNRQHAVDTLRKRNFVITALREENVTQVSTWLRAWRGVPEMEKIVFTRQLGTMIGAGLPINQALKLLSSQTTNQYFAEIISDVTQNIDGGSSLHDALSNYEKVFGRLYLSLIRAGESSGNLELILSRLADTLEAEANFRGKVRSALVYPVIIVIVMVLVLLVMFVFVIPRLSQLYDELGAELPLMTRLLIDFSNFIKNFIWLIIPGFFVAYWLYRRAYNTNIEFADRVSRFQLHAPIFGPLSIEIQLTSFTRTLGMLLGSGISLLEALDIAKETMTNLIFRSAVEEAAMMVEKGKPLSEGFKRHEAMPPLVGEMLAVGEQTGKVEEVLDKLSSYFESQASRKTTNLASAIEPIVMVVLGVLVGFLVVALILPIYSLTSQF